MASHIITKPLFLAIWAVIIFICCTGCSSNSKTFCSSDEDCYSGRNCFYGACLWQDEVLRANSGADALAWHLLLALKKNDLALLSGSLFDASELAEVFNLGDRQNAAPVFVVYSKTLLDDFEYLANLHSYSECSSAYLSLGSPARVHSAIGTVIFEGSRVEFDCNGKVLFVPVENVVWNGKRFLILTLVAKNLTGLQ